MEVKVLWEALYDNPVGGKINTLLSVRKEQ
jgi:hypothetical protein